MSTIIRNDGKYAFFDKNLADGKMLRLKFKGEENVIEIRMGFHGTNTIEVTSDFRVQVSGYILSDSHEPEDLRIRLAEVGLVLEVNSTEAERASVKPLRNKMGELDTNIDSLMGMAGYGPEAHLWETTSNGLVYYICLGRRHPDVAPRLASEVRSEAHKIVESARIWIHQNMRGFKRAVKMDNWDAVQLWKVAQKATIIRVKLGETVEVETSTGSYFGSGGGWGRHEEWGQFTREWVKSDDNGFTTHPFYRYTFDKGPAVVYTATGDGINGGRTHWRKLYVAE